MNPQSAWDGILDDDEEIRWQGRPDGAVVWRATHLATGLFGLAFAGFALFWMIMAAQAGGGFWMFGLLHFAVGLGIGIAPPFWNAYRRHPAYPGLEQAGHFLANLALVSRAVSPLQSDTIT